MDAKVIVDLERLRYPNTGLAEVAAGLYSGLIEMEFPAIFYGSRSEVFKTQLSWHNIHRFWHPLPSSAKLVHILHQGSSYFPNSRGIKKIVTLHDLNFLHENIAEVKKKKIIKSIRRNMDDADYVVCISEFVKNDYLQNRHLFDPKPSQEIKVIHNGLRFPDTGSKLALTKYGFLEGKKYFLNIGVLFPKKNQVSILRALTFLEEDLVLVVSAGKSEYEAEILRYIKKNKLEDRVHILRNITDEDKYALIRNCEALLHPSLAEGFGIPPIEAMYFGKPVFLSKLTSLPEIGGTHAFYFEDFTPENMAAVIRTGLGKYNAQPEMYKQIKDWAMQFDYRKMTANYVRLYQEVLSSS